jgi:hypothetical protein
MWDAKEVSLNDQTFFIRYDETPALKMTSVTIERDGFLYHAQATNGFDLSIASFLLHFEGLEVCRIDDEFITVTEAQFPTEFSFDRIAIIPPKGERLMHLEELQGLSFLVIPSYITEYWNQMTFKEFDFQFWRKDGNAISFLDWEREAP